MMSELTQSLHVIINCKHLANVPIIYLASDFIDALCDPLNLNFINLKILMINEQPLASAARRGGSKGLGTVQHSS